MALFRDAQTIMWRESRFLMRNPVPVVLGFVNPLLWLLLFGAVFYNLARFPGFPAPNYTTFLVPGILAMNAVARGLISCFNIVWHRHYGFLDKILVSPISRSSIFLGQVTITALFGIGESLLIVCVGLLMGLKMAAGWACIPIIVLSYLLLQLTFISLSMMMVRMLPEQFIGMLQLLILPPVFLSSALFPLAFAPSFIRKVAIFNPLTHAVEAMRLTFVDGIHWSKIGYHLGIVAFTSLILLLLSHRMFVSGVGKDSEIAS